MDASCIGNLPPGVIPILSVTHYYFLCTIDRNCDVLPLLKFCTNKPILASLLRQFFLGGGGRGRFAQKKGVTLLPRATDF